MTNNYYKTLGVDILASKEDIRKAYLILAKKYHPDRNLDNKEEAEEKFKEITEAYETLYDDDLRARYDIQLRYVIETPKSQMETYQPCEEEKSEYIQLKRKTLKLVAMFLAIMLVAGIVLFFEYKYIQHSRRNSLEPGMTVDEVVEIYGEPSEITDDAIFYQTAKIYLRNGKVLGWYNADDILDIKNVDVENIYDIKVGENIEDIFHDYGYPDTYGQTFVTYYDVIIMYKDGRVTEVTRYSSD